ncbi:MAG: phosphate acyltransferase PlsX [Clostridia bacterium]|nr:phosphate acyltransferase PlsX [Clostridia bacterium]
MKKVVLDVFTGDNPEQLIKGATEAVKKYDNLKIIMPGDKDFLTSQLAQYEYDTDRIEVVHASQIISNNESPTMAIKQKKDSTIVVGMNILNSDPDVIGLISAGSTGAILCGGIFITGRLSGVDRPALAAVLPTEDGNNVCLMDCGANSDCLPEYLAQFALLGSALMKSAYGVENPRTALVCVGTEDHKGSKLTHAAFDLIKDLPVNFLGNMESRDVLSGKYDVLVCDGFTGNVLLKSIEGTATLVIRKMVGALKNNLPEGTDGSFIKKSVGQVMVDLDYNSNGGAILLGCKKPIAKIHGSANANTISAVIGQMIKMYETEMISKVSAALEQLKKD